MSRDAFGRIGCFEDFQGLEDPDGVTITNTASVRWNDVLLIPVSGNVALTNIVTEGGGVIAFVGAGSAADGVAICSSPMQPSGDGTIRMGARFQTSAVTTLQMFVGWQETLDTDAATNPFTLSSTTLTANDVGQCVGLYFDTTASTDDWRMQGSSDGTAFTAALDTLGARAYAAPAASSWMVARVEIDPDGTARCYYGDVGNDPSGGGPKLIGTLAKDNLDEDALYHPVIHLIDPGTTDPTWNVDYFYAKGNRDWTV